MRSRYAAGTALALALLASCSIGDEPEGADPAPSTSSPTTTSATQDTTDPEPGTTTTADPATNLLDWTSLGEPERNTVIRSSGWILSVPDSGAEARLVGEDTEETIPAGRGRRITDAFLDGRHAVVVAQDQAERRPQTITVVALEPHARTIVRSPRPGTGGPVAYDGGTLTYATYRPGGEFCLATYDVAADAGEKGYCAPKREGFSNTSVSPAGIGLMTFDDARPVSCRSLVEVDGAGSTPVPGVPDCTGWDVLLTGSGAVWSTLPNEKRVERGQFFATADGSVTALGPGTTGTLTWCGDSAYFARDAQKDRDKARLLRWTPDDELEVVYETRGLGEAFLAPPACADGVLTVTAYAEGGDERVWATVPG